MNLKLDPWQEEFLATEGDKILCCGRQIGKSVICSIDAAVYGTKHKNKSLLMISKTERQAYALFDKTLSHLSMYYPHHIKKGKDRPTKSRIKLTNGTIIHCLPAGLTGEGLRFLTVDRLYIDEAAFVDDSVWTAVTPMLLTTGGDTILLSTPFGDEGFFADVFENKDGAFESYTRFSMFSQTVIEEREICDSWHEWRKEKALARLEQEKSRMTQLQYAQEYEGQIIRELRQFFPTELINKCMIIDPEAKNHLTRNLEFNTDVFLGVDLARKGGDETALVGLAKDRRDKLRQCYLDIRTELTIPDNYRVIKSADSKFGFKMIYLDDGGLGAGVLDLCMEDEELRRRVTPVNNSARPLYYDERQKKKILKEDLYVNLLSLMEHTKIALFKDENTYQSLKSIQYEYKNGHIRIFGKYTHITEALIRAAWCMKDKRLNIWIS